MVRSVRFKTPDALGNVMVEPAITDPQSGQMSYKCWGHNISTQRLYHRASRCIKEH